MIKRMLPLFSLFFFCVMNVFAQTTDTVEMADTLRANGKIFVVVGVIAIVFTCIVIYLISIDRKVSRLEKKNVDLKMENIFSEKMLKNLIIKDKN